MAIFNSDNFEVGLQYRIASLFNQLLSEFSTNYFETLQRYYKYFEDLQ